MLGYKGNAHNVRHFLFLKTLQRNKTIESFSPKKRKYFHENIFYVQSTTNTFLVSYIFSTKMLARQFLFH